MNNNSHSLSESIKQLMGDDQLWTEIKPKIISLINSILDSKIEKYDIDQHTHPLPAFKEAFERNDFFDRYRALARGLDDESLSNIGFILNRLQYCTSRPGPWNVFTSKELALRHEFRETFIRQIVKISDELFAYRNYYLPAYLFDASVFYYNLCLEHFDHLERLRNKDIIDVGAFIGDSLLLLSPLTSRKVYAFEASKTNYSNMLKTIELNSIQNACPEHLALGIRNGTIEVSGYTDIPSYSSVTGELCLVPTNQDTTLKYAETVCVETLDNYVEKNHLDVGLIKADIEGAEQDFLKGAINTIKKQRPSLLISIYHNPNDFFDIKPMIESWDLGYKFKVIKCPMHLFVETMLLAEV